MVFGDSYESQAETRGCASYFCAGELVTLKETTFTVQEIHFVQKYVELETGLAPTSLRTENPPFLPPLRGLSTCRCPGVLPWFPLLVRCVALVASLSWLSFCGRSGSL